MTYRFAAQNDLTLLAGLNEQLIRDESHRSRMTVSDLELRLSQWLNEGYSAIIFEAADRTAGYALFRLETEFVYLKQFFVKAEFRRGGVGKAAMQWLVTNAWNDQTCVRLDVLVGNAAAIAFWKSLGFTDYCTTMELPLSDDRSLR